MAVEPTLDARTDRPHPLLAKVPEITVAFWAIKIVSTAMGEAVADFLDGGSGLVFPALGALLALVAFVLALRWQLRAPVYRPVTYWTAVGMVAVFGTMVADAVHQFTGAPYWSTTILYAVILAVVFRQWYASEGTLSIHSITTPRRERFYWATVLSTFALGTAAGDWTAANLHLGYLDSALAFTGAICLPLLAYRVTALSTVGVFWTAYVLTRPLGASYADWSDVTRHAGGLGLGRGPVGGALIVVMVLLVVVAATRRRAP